MIYTRGLEQGRFAVRAFPFATLITPPQNKKRPRCGRGQYVADRSRTFVRRVYSTPIAGGTTGDRKPRHSNQQSWGLDQARALEQSAICLVGLDSLFGEKECG